VRPAYPLHLKAVSLRNFLLNTLLPSHMFVVIGQRDHLFQRLNTNGLHCIENEPNIRMAEHDWLFKFEIGFFGVLLEIYQKTSVFLHVPDTIIEGFGFDSPTLFTTNHVTGELIIRTDISPAAISEVFAYFQEAERDSLFPIAVLKTGSVADQDHSRVLMTADECRMKWEETSGLGKAIQRFVRKNPSLEMIKTAWDGQTSKMTSFEVQKHKNIREAADAIIRKKNAMTLKRKSMIKENQIKFQKEMFQIFQNDVNLRISNVALPNLERKMMYLVNIFERYYLKEPNLKVISLDADWIEDSYGRIYLICVRKYRIGEIDAFRPNVCLFTVPKVQVNEFTQNKVRPAINLKKKLNVGMKISQTATVLSKSMNLP
jgi:hypothetical protein